MPLRFENCTLDPATREFRRGAELIPLEPQVFDLLVYVIRNRDRVVSKDDLIEAVWGGRIVSESSLTTRINAARKALGDSGEEQRLIRTVARKGIRFIGAVTEGQAAVPAAASVAALTPERPALPLPDKPSIAVLPFQNMSGDPEQEYFADGLTEDVITALSQWRWFLVIAAGSSFAYKNRSVDLKQIGRELGVQYLLQGSVRRAGIKIRVTGQLIDAATGSNLWSERSDRDFIDIFEIQDEFAGRIAQSLSFELAEVESLRRVQRRPRHLEAVDLVLRARAIANRPWSSLAAVREHVAEPRRLLMRAAALDEKVPGLFAEIARTHMNEAGLFLGGDREECLKQATIAADRALDIDANDAAANLWKGVTQRLRGNLAGAFGSLKRAVDLNPNYAHAFTHLAGTYAQAGDQAEAHEAAARSFRLSPKHIHGIGYQSLVHFHAGRFDDAATWARKTLVVAPSFWVAHAHLAASLALLGKFDEARGAVADMTRLANITSLRTVRSLEFPGSSEWQARLAQMYEALGSAGLPE